MSLSLISLPGLMLSVSGENLNSEFLIWTINTTTPKSNVTLQKTGDVSLDVVFSNGEIIVLYW